MLSGHQSFRKLNIMSKKRHKVEPLPKTTHQSIDDLACIVKRLSCQIEDLENWKEEAKQQKKKDALVDAELNQKMQSQPLPPLPEPNVTSNDIIIDPWASSVPQNYGTLLQKLEDLQNCRNCPNACCSSSGVVSSADGVPWPKPIEPFQSTNIGYYGNVQQNLNDMLEIQYTHWCTLLRSLPLMDPATSDYVKTVGLYAMREILKCKAHQKREHEHTTKQVNHTELNTTPTKLRDSLSYLSLSDKIPLNDINNSAASPVSAIPTATQDMPSWMTTSETKVALDEISTPVAPPKETVITPTSSGANSPLFSGKRFQKWVKYKKLQRKANTDTSTTPLAQSQTLRKIGSWFF